jgi:glycosyltransferase involved in cell wall biosynthesis
MSHAARLRPRSGAPTVALVHDNFDGPTGMGLVLNHHAGFVLDAGFELCIVGDNVPDDLRARAARVVTVRNPRGLPALPEHLEWCRRARVALRDVRADIVHVHSPFLAAHADVQTAHFISQAAFDHGSREPRRGAEGALRRAQARVTRHADNRLYRRARRRTYLSFVSELLRAEFRRLYAAPRGGWLFRPPAPPWRPVAPEERARARARLGVPPGAVTVGYLGGADHRKGFDAVLGLEPAADLHLLFAGPDSERVTIAGRRGLGFVEPGPFLAACDALVAPTRFDPAPVAVLEALSRGVPVVTTPASGWAEPIRRHGCGVVWEADATTLADACRVAAATPPERCRAFVADVAPEREREVLVGAYEQILAARR